MSEGRWREVDEVLGDLLELPADQRMEQLARRRVEPVVRIRVEALLQAWHDSEEFLESPVLCFTPAAPERMIGKRFGVWRLVSLIGSGGMGTVYLAERDDQQFNQRAAVKFISAGAMSPSSEQHFLEERQILARLEHPNVARLVDGGIAEDGSPFLAMEYIEGIPINAWCRQRSLTVPERLDLFRQVFAAVQFAHQNLIVHCDLKPANVLVTPDGQVKLLDFGIARIAGRQQDGTATLLRPMTLDYASPEQVRGKPVTTASDVYSLGILMYRLLTGRRPYQLQGKPLDEVLTTVCEDDTAEPGTVSRDLDAVILKALRKDPGHRYPSAAEMWADVQRYLAGMPVEARPRTAGYIFRRFTARHRVSVATAAAALLMVVISGAMLFRESRIATNRFNHLRRLAHFVIFDMHDAVAPLSGSTPARKLLVAQGLQYLDELAADAPGEPELQLELASAYLRLGDVSGYVAEANLGDADGALRSYRKALGILEPFCASNPHDLVAARALSSAYQHLSHVLQTRDPAEAMVTAQKLLAFKLKQSKLQSGDQYRAGLAIAYDTRAGVAETLNRHDQALRDWLAAVEIWEELLAKAPGDAKRQRNAALGHKYTAARLIERGADLAQAAFHLNRAEELDRKRVAATPGDREARIDLSYDLSQDGFFQWKKRQQPSVAKDLFQRALAIRQDLAQSDPSDVRLRTGIAYLRNQLGSLALESGNAAEAIAHLDVTERIEHELYKRDSSTSNRNNLAGTLQTIGQANQALGRHSAACQAWEASWQLLEESVRSGKSSAHPGKEFEEVGHLLETCKAASASAGQKGVSH